MWYTTCTTDYACGFVVLCFLVVTLYAITWWRHQMETFSALLAICMGNSPVPGEFPAQRPVTRSFDVFFDLRLNKRLSKQSWGWWFETLPRPLWSHCNDLMTMVYVPRYIRVVSLAELFHIWLNHSEWSTSWRIFIKYIPSPGVTLVIVGNFSHFRKNNFAKFQ